MTLAGCGQNREAEPPVASSSASGAGSGGSGGDGAGAGGASGATGGGGAGEAGGAEGGGGAGEAGGAEGGGGASGATGGGGAGEAGGAEGGGGAGEAGGAEGGGGAGGATGGGGAGEAGGAEGGGGAGGSLPAGAWHRHIFGPHSQTATAVAIDREANVVLAGSANGAVDFGAGPTPLIAGNDFGGSDFFVVKYADDGALRWARRFGGKEVLATGVAVDGNDGIAVVGHYSKGPLHVGDLVPEEPERDDVMSYSPNLFVLALDRDGAPRWMHRLGDHDADLGGRVAIGPENDVVVAAQSGDRLTLVRFAADGTTRFATDAGTMFGADNLIAPIGGVAVDLHGDILVTGTISHDDDGRGVASGLRGGRVWVAKYSGEDGAHLWSRHFDASEDIGLGTGNVAQTLLVDDHGDALVAGQFAREDAFSKPPIYGSGGAFFMKLAGEDGALRWAKMFPAKATEIGSTSLSFAPDGRVALIASFGAPTDLGGGSLSEPGSYVATYAPDTGAFVAQRRLIELGTMDGSFGRTASTLDAKGRLSLVMNFINGHEPQTAFGTVKAEGLDGILLVHLPL
ncbi:hypothetical protein [Sorangium cellulosum]|nr:hypothetical protein [Sorangium cellulosum]